MSKTVEFILPTYNRKEPLRAMLSSLLAQTNPNWTAKVIQDGTDNSISEEIVKSLGDKRITHKYNLIRYNDYGHSLREIGKQEVTGDYLCLTNDDNYYMPTFVDEVIKNSEDNPGMIYCDMVHSHYDYAYFKCSPGYNQIDMGAFATRTDLAKQIKLGTSFAADGLFVEDFKKKFPQEEIRKIHKVLFVHN